MIRILQYLILGHIHKWKTVKETRYNLHAGNPEIIVARGDLYVLQCECCGNMKKFKV